MVVFLRRMIIPASALSMMRVATLAPALALTGPSDASAQASGAVYVRRDDCIAAARLTPAQCEFAYRNARAEFLQKAPRYASRSTCERGHKRCVAQLVSAGGWESFGKSAATYVPRFVGIRVTGEGEARRALPVIEGISRAAFLGRPVTELQEQVVGRANVVGVVSHAGRSSRRHYTNTPDNVTSPAGSHDDTERVPMKEESIGADVPPGLYVDPDGVEWYKPAHKR